MAKKEQTWGEWFTYQWKTAPYRVISIVLCALTLIFYVVQVGIVFALFEFWKVPLVIVYTSPGKKKII
jgi:hypothetical protein